MASFSSNSSALSFVFAIIPTHGVPLSFWDTLIGLCAGREAKLRIERRRLLRYFQSLPESSNGSLTSSLNPSFISDYSSFSSVFTCPQSSSVSIQSPATINSGSSSPYPARCAYTQNRRKVLDLESATYQAMAFLYGTPPKGPVMYHEPTIFPNTMMVPTAPFVPANYDVPYEAPAASPPRLPIPRDVMTKIAHTTTCNNIKPAGNHHVLTPVLAEPININIPRAYCSNDFFAPAPLPPRPNYHCKDYYNTVNYNPLFINATRDDDSMRKLRAKQAMQGPVKIIPSIQLFGKGRVADLKAPPPAIRRPVPRPVLRRPQFAKMRRTSKYSESGTRVE